MKKGSITIYFALIFTVLVSFVLSVFEGIKVNAIRLKAECAYTAAQNSVLSEYHTGLLEMFDLFYIDTSYKSGGPDYHNVEARLWEYVEKNYKDAPASVEICQITMATDNQGIPYRKQISDYMKDKIGLSYIEELTSLFETVSKEGFMQENGESNNVWNEKWQETLAERESIPEETWSVVEQHCPVNDVENIRKSFVLNQVVKEEAEISKKQVNLNNYVSNRNCVVGTGTDKELSFLDKIYFIGYVFEKFSYYSKKDANNLLDYEIEYLIGGKNNDYENLSTIAKKLLLLREAINVIYLMTDTEKMMLIDTVSSVLSWLVLSPEIAPIIKIAIVGLWSYMESVQDVKILFEGGCVPLMKSKSSWHTDLGSGLDIIFQTRETSQNKEGMNYKQYLELLLLFADNEKITYRSMDLIEMHIQKTDGNENFRFDGCAEDFLVNIVFDISMFGSYQIVRKFGYFY